MQQTTSGSQNEAHDTNTHSNLQQIGLPTASWLQSRSGCQPTEELQTPLLLSDVEPRRREFGEPQTLTRSTNNSLRRNNTKRRAELAKQETIDTIDYMPSPTLKRNNNNNSASKTLKQQPDNSHHAFHSINMNNNNNNNHNKHKQQDSSFLPHLSSQCCCYQYLVSCYERTHKMTSYLFKQHSCFVWTVLLFTLTLVTYVAAIYHVPFISIETSVPQALPHIPFNYHDGPLKATSASALKHQHLFQNQINGPESLAVDSSGNLYMATEGGFVLYGRLNRSAPIKLAYYDEDLQQRILSKIQFAGGQMMSPPPPIISPVAIQAADQSSLVPELVKIAELNAPIKHVVFGQQRLLNQTTNKIQLDSSLAESPPTIPYVWRRECHLDEQIYGPQLHWPDSYNQMDEREFERIKSSAGSKRNFVSHLSVSRCSKPLGIRLSPDENYLYIIDTLSGLYRVNLNKQDRKNHNFYTNYGQLAAPMRQVTKLIDFKRTQTLPAIHLDRDGGDSVRVGDTATNEVAPLGGDAGGQPTREQLTADLSVNVSFSAVDDLVVDYGAGTNGHDHIYMTVASQKWPATSFLYDYLEGRPSGLIVRFDTGTNKLVALDPRQMSHVRTSALDMADQKSRLYKRTSPSMSILSSVTVIDDNNQLVDRTVGDTLDEMDTTLAHRDSNAVDQFQPTEDAGANLRLSRATDRQMPYMGIGAPHLNEDDVFDDRPLHFPNGIELTDDKQALLIADTSNKRIIKHYIRGARRGTSDLWAWTPNFPDNIRRGFERRDETYWVVGCGCQPAHLNDYPPSSDDSADTEHNNNNNSYRNNNKAEFNLMLALRSWPRLRKFILKQIYVFGWFIELIGHYILNSVVVRDFGYEFKSGNALLKMGCQGMMVLQYNQNGDLVRSIHSREFPNDLQYYSQVNELIDANNQEHALYLGSPAYQYVTKLTLPTQSFDAPAAISYDQR